MHAAKIGLIHKYNVTKANGTPTDPGAYYFVLRIDNGGEFEHVQACRKALQVYADNIRKTLPLLAEDLDKDLHELGLPWTNAKPVKPPAVDLNTVLPLLASDLGGELDCKAIDCAYTPLYNVPQPPSTVAEDVTREQVRDAITAHRQAHTDQINDLKK